MPALWIKGVSFSYPAGFALGDINLEIPEQSFLALIGPNGSGKSTLLRLMSGLLRPDCGEIYLDDRSVGEIGRRELAGQVAVISSEQFFEFPFPVAEIVAMGRFPHLGNFQKMTDQDWKAVEEALRMTNTEHLRTRPISQLSSGERQRVLIARAIAQQPSILMLDEPNAHLDINHEIGIFHLLQFLNREHGMTVIVVLHDLTAAAAFCRSVALLHQGRLIKHGSPEEVITSEMIRRTYGADVVVHPSPVGGFPQISYAPK
ncbi:MAG TPA: ABC transporter ATP-binding protein [Acidobacteriota bacterium]|jgi:iron complex transport system ATP-binding protein|nr:ABC transporter ATP-binding protein [Acidobacteriota bacterium]